MCAIIVGCRIIGRLLGIMKDHYLPVSGDHYNFFCVMKRRLYNMGKWIVSMWRERVRSFIGEVCFTYCSSTAMKLLSQILNERGRFHNNILIH